MEHHQRLLSALVPLLAPVPSGFTHNDVHGDNLIDDGERVWLVDWEYAGQGQPLADIASLANNALMTEETAEAALRQWLDRLVLKSDRAAFAAMRLATALRTCSGAMRRIHSPNGRKPASPSTSRSTKPA